MRIPFQEPAKLIRTHAMRWWELRQQWTRNIGLRVLAVLIATGLWVFVNAGQHESQVALVVPVEYRALAPGLVLTNQHPDFINLSISGPHTLLSLLDSSRLAVRLDLHGVSAGQTDFKITPDMFRIPRQTTIDSISPSQITLDIDQLTTKELPVRLNITGQAAPGLGIGPVQIKPAAVTATGPSRALHNMDAIETMPFDVQGSNNVVSHTVQLVDVGELIKLSTSWVTATVRFQEVESEREFRGVPVTVRNSDYKFSIHPLQVSVTVRGTEKRLAGIALDGSVYVDARDLEAGWYEAPVLVDLPKGIEVVRERPDKVRLRIYQTKIGTKG